MGSLRANFELLHSSIIRHWMDRQMTAINALWGRRHNELCGRPPQYAPPLQVDLFIVKVVSESRVTWGYLCANFSLPRPLCSRLRPDVRDRQTSDRAGHNNRIYIAPYGRNFRGAEQSQINEDTVKPSLTGQDINPIAYLA